MDIDFGPVREALVAKGINPDGLTVTITGGPLEEAITATIPAEEG